MSFSVEHPAADTAEVLLVVLTGAILLAFYRLVRGPTLPDRVVALDTIATLTVGMIALYSIAVSETALLRVGMVLALINFVGTVAFAFYLKRKALAWSNGSPLS